MRVEPIEKSPQQSWAGLSQQPRLSEQAGRAAPFHSPEEGDDPDPPPAAPAAYPWPRVFPGL